MSEKFLNIKRQDQVPQKRPKANDPTPDQWKSFLLRKIKSFQKSKNLDLFTIFKYWFIAAENDPLIDFEFVYSSPLISILQYHLLNYHDFNTAVPLINILQIVSVLTSLNAPETLFFSTPELFQVYIKLLSDQNENIVKFVLIILSQLLYKQPNLLSFYYSVDLTPSILSNFLASNNESISGISAFFLCEISQLDQEKANDVLQALFNFSITGAHKPVSTLFKSLLLFSSNSPEFLKVILNNNFGALCNQILPLITDKTINIAISIFSILSLAITDHHGLEIFIASNIIGTISQCNYINPAQNSELFSILMDLLSKLILLSNPAIIQQIISYNIIEKCCLCIESSEYCSKMNAMGFISTIFLNKNRDLCKIVDKSSGIRLFLDNFDTFNEELASVAIQSFISFLSICPELKDSFATLDIDRFTDIIEQFSEEIAKQGYVLLSLIH